MTRQGREDSSGQVGGRGEGFRERRVSEFQATLELNLGPRPFHFFLY